VDVSLDSVINTLKYISKVYDEGVIIANEAVRIVKEAVKIDEQELLYEGGGFMGVEFPIIPRVKKSTPSLMAAYTLTLDVKGLTCELANIISQAIKINEIYNEMALIYGIYNYLESNEIVCATQVLTPSKGALDLILPGLAIPLIFEF
jgi:hypothetical protein